MAAWNTVPALAQAKSKYRGPRMRRLAFSVKAAILAKYFREDSPLSAEGNEGISVMKDLEADYEFEMLALDGLAARSV